MSTHPLQLEHELHTLANGLRVVLHRDNSLPLVAVNLWYHVGSKNERPGRTGFAHLFEHMLFQGSENVGTNGHFRYIQQVGGSANGSTWYDRTNYYETLPSHNLRLGLWLESDRMGYLLPAITQEKLNMQRSVVINERRQRIDNRPYGIAYERLNELLYPADHPYHWPVIGYVEDLEAATLEDVQDFFRTHYSPANAVLTLAGDFETAAALEEVERFFGPIPGVEPPPPVIPPLHPLGGEQREVIEDAIQLPRIYMGFRAPAFGEPLWYAADLLSTALAGGKASPMYQDLVYDRQIAQDVSCFILPLEAVATFFIVATCSPGVEPSVLEAALQAHIDRAMEKPLAEEDLRRARNKVLTGLFRELQTLDSKADLFSELTTYFNDPGRLRREPEHYDRVTPEAVQRFATRHLQSTDRVVLTFVPKSEAARES